MFAKQSQEHAQRGANVAPDCLAGFFGGSIGGSFAQDGGMDYCISRGQAARQGYNLVLRYKACCLFIFEMVVKCDICYWF